MVARNQCTWSILVLVVILNQVHGAFKCTIKTNQGNNEYKLSSNAIQGILMKGGQSSSNFQAVDCVCEGSATHILDDKIDSEFPKATSDPQWEDSAVFRVRRCQKLEVSLINTFVAEKMNRSALIIEDVDDLNIKAFRYGEQGVGVRKNNERFSSIYFRNVNLTAFGRDDLLFEEKVEVLFHQVRMQPTVRNELNIAMTNTVIDSNPILRIEECQFNLGKDIGAKDPLITIDVRNGQKVKEPQGNCLEYFDYKGEVYIKRNSFGLLGQGKIVVNGAAKTIITDNVIEVLGQTREDKAAIELQQVKEIEVSGNTIRYDLQDTWLKIVYEKDPSRCANIFDMPVDRIQAKVQQNRMWRVKKNMIKVDYFGYTPAEEVMIAKKIIVDENMATAYCRCTELEESTTDNPQRILQNRLMVESMCTSSVTGGLGTRKKICNGDHPRSWRDSLLYNLGLKNGVTSLIPSTLLAPLLATALMPLGMGWF